MTAYSERRGREKGNRKEYERACGGEDLNKKGII
jgi:hypothetical protein